MNWGWIQNDEFDKLVKDARSSFDGKARDAALARLHERAVEESYFLFWVHDVGPRVMSPKVKRFVQAKNWFQDAAYAAELGYRPPPTSAEALRHAEAGADAATIGQWECSPSSNAEGDRQVGTAQGR